MNKQAAQRSTRFERDFVSSLQKAQLEHSICAHRSPVDMRRALLLLAICNNNLTPHKLQLETPLKNCLKFRTNGDGSILHMEMMGELKGRNVSNQSNALLNACMNNTSGKTSDVQHSRQRVA